MAKLEIPSIVVHSGSPSVPGVSMERTARQTPQLRKQKSSIDDGEAIAGGCIHHHHSKSDSGGPGPTNSTSSCSNISQTKADVSSGGGASCKPGSPGGTNSRSEDVDKAVNGPQPQLSRSRSNAKMKMLTRSHAMREATSPPPDPAAMAQMSSSASSTAATQVASTTSNQQSTPASVVNTTNGKSNGQASKANNNNNNNHSGSNHHHHTSNNNNFKNKNGNNKISKDQNISSNRPSNHRAPQNKNYIYISSPQEAWGGLLSQDYSTTLQCQDAAKADLLGFIAAQMTTKNRPLLLRVEEELKQLVQDQRPIFFRFPQMTSFHRMLVHRAATYFQMDHNLDASGTCVIVNRNKSTRMPERTFFQVMKDMKGLSARAYSSEEPRKSILKRDYASFEDNQFKSDEKQLSLESRRSKSFEEREEEYERARRRIFSRDDSTESCQRSESNQDSMEDVRWSECATWPCDEPEPPGRYLRPNDRPGRLMKTESYESRDTSRSNSSRSAVSKSYSFGGYTGNGSSNGRLGPSPSHGQSFAALPRGDSNASSLSAGSRVLAKQDSGSSVSSRLSPSSSGYKSQSQQSDATLSATPSPTATPLSLLPMSSQGSQDTLSPEPPVIWPMTSMGNIPPGSVLINPATGQPICNADGSVYRYDPENPLTLHVPAEGTAKSPPTSQSGRLSDDCAKSNTPEQETSWANQSSQSPKVTQTSNTPSPKLEASKPGFQQPPHKPASQFDKPQTDKAASASDQSKTSQNQQEKRSYYNNNQAREREDHRGNQGSKGESTSTSTTTSSTSSSSSSSLSVPERSVTNTATSPMLVAASSTASNAAPSPQRPLPLPLPLVVGAPGAAAAPGGAVPPPPQPQAGTYPLPMVAYPVQPVQPPHYPNGSYTYAAAPPGDGQAYYGGAVPGVPGVPGVPYVGGCGYALDPATGSYVAQPQQAQQPPPPAGQPPPVGPAPPPCCLPGYPCMYAAPTAGPPPPGPHSGYDHRGSDVTGQAVNEVTGYMIGMSLNGNPGGPVVDQRAGGDAGPGSARNDGQSPLQGPGPGGPPTPHIMVAGNGSYYWGPQISSQNQGYPPTVMYYYPPNNVTSPQNPTGVAAGSAPASGSNSNSNYNRGTSPQTNSRENSNNKNSSNSTGSTSSSSPGNNNRNSYSRNVAASYAKGAAIFQPPAYSMPNMGVAPQTQDRTVINGYPNDCVGVAPPQQQVVYTVSSMHTSTVPTQSYQPSVYSNANVAMSGSGAPPGALAYYQGAGDGPSQAPGQPQGQPLVPMNPYAGPQGYMPAPGTPPITQTSYGVHPYVYGMYSQTANGPGGPTSPATYPNVAPHQSPMIQRMMRPNLSSPPPRTAGPKGFPRGQSPGTRKDHGGSGDNIRFSQPYSMPMYNLAASRYMSTGDMRYMAGRLPFSIPTNSYHRAIRPFQTSYYPRPHSQPSGEALGLTRPPRVRKPTPQARSPARGPFVGRDFNAYSKPPAVMRTS